MTLIDERFELGALSGKGGFADVYRALDRWTGGDVAVKRLHATAGDAAAAVRFEREARLLARVDSPHVVRYVAHGVDARGRFYLATEWLDGLSLATHLARGRFTIARSVGIVVQVARGVEALHAVGILHRDLKPGNIFLAKTGAETVVKLIDLGIATAHDEVALTAQGLVVGSPVYLSPEQARGDELGPPSDVYSLGVVLFEMLTGRQPFTGADPLAVLGRVVLEVPPRVRALRPEIPAALDEVVARVLTKDPAARYGSAAEFALAALDGLQGVAPAPQPDTVPPPPMPSSGPSREAETASERPPSDPGAETVEGAATTTAPDAPPEAATVPERAPEATTAPAPTASAPAAGGDRRPSSPVAADERRVLVALVAAADGPAGAPDALRAVERAVRAQGGRVEAVRGTRLLGVFGGGRARGDEAPRAARAALAAQAMGARLAIATGFAHQDRGALAGEALDRAAEMLHRAAPGEVRVDAATAALLGRDFALAPDDRGAALVGEATPAAAPSPEGAAPFVGREHELAHVMGVVRDAWEARAPHVVLLVGDAGIGKSRLRGEVVARLDAAGARHDVVAVRGEPVLVHTPFGAMTRTLRERAGVLDGEDRATQRDKLRALARRGGAGVAVEFLGEVARVAFDVEDSAALRVARRNPRFMRDQIRAAVADLLRALGAYTPVLVVLEDLQWVDRETIDLGAYLVDALADVPVAFLALARPEVEAHLGDLWARVPKTELRIGPLSSRAADRIVLATLGPADPGVRRALITRAAGNPLFLEELVRAAADGRADALPAAIHAALQVRLDALDPAARRAARAASVFGAVFWQAGLEALAPGVPVGDALAALTEAAWVAPRPSSRIAGTREYAFRHQLMRDVAYATLLDADRATLHARAGAWLEGVGEFDPAVLAYHSEVGGDDARARERYTLAARLARDDQAWEAARDYASRALALGPEPAERYDLLLTRADAALALARGAAALDDAREALALAGDDAARRVEVAVRAAQAQGYVGRPDAGIVALRDALAAARDAPVPPALRLAAMLRQAQLLLQRGRAAEALALARSAVDDPDAPPDAVAAVQLLADGVLGTAAVALGDLDDALATYRAAHARARRGNDLARQLLAAVYIGAVHNLLGAYAEAAGQLAEARDAARRARLPLAEGLALCNLGMSRARGGDLAAGVRAEEDALALAQRNRLPRLALGARIYTARFCEERAATGDLDRALTELAAAEADGRSYTPLQALVRAVRARVLLRRGRAELALRESGAAVSPLDEGGTSYDEGEEYTRLAYVDALIAAGRGAEADAALARARARLLEKAARIGDEARRASFLARVPEHRRILELARERLER